MQQTRWKPGSDWHRRRSDCCIPETISGGLAVQSERPEPELRRLAVESGARIRLGRQYVRSQLSNSTLCCHEYWLSGGNSWPDFHRRFCAQRANALLSWGGSKPHG